jgi:hypothetical protein
VRLGLHALQALLSKTSDSQGSTRGCARFVNSQELKSHFKDFSPCFNQMDVSGGSIFIGWIYFHGQPSHFPIDNGYAVLLYNVLH